MTNNADQFDLPAARARWLAEKNREAADAARVAYQFPPSVREERVAHYLAEAERYEAIGAEAGGSERIND